MINFNFIFGTVEDVAGFFVLPSFLNLLKPSHFLLYGYPFGLTESIFSYTEPLSIFPLYLASIFLGPIITYNIFVLVTLALTFLASYKFFTHYIDNSKISFAMAVLFTTSPYITYHIQSHPQLSQVWLGIGFLIYYFHREKNLKSSLISGLFLSLVFLTSNYIGFFVGIICFLYFLLEQLRNLNKNEIKRFIILIFSFIITTLPWLISTIKNNQSNYSIEGALTRPIDDFITFGSKPWLYITPPLENPLVGFIGEKIVLFFKENFTNSWTQNYFIPEMQSLYFGLSNILILIIGFRLLKKDIKVFEQLKNLGIIGIILSVITLPPYFTVKGITIYLPSFLIWKIFPMFRVLARASIFEYLILLTIVGVCATLIIKKYKKIGILITSALITFSFLEHLIPYKITQISETPEIYKYMGKALNKNYSAIIYPQSFTKNYFFWMPTHQTPITNPSGFKFGDFDSNKFTKEINTCEGLKMARYLGVKYLIVYNQENEVSFFKNNKNLKQLFKFNERNNLKETNYLLLKINNISYLPETFLFELEDQIICEK